VILRGGPFDETFTLKALFGINDGMKNKSTFFVTENIEILALY
jgi:hypothetical protein